MKIRYAILAVSLLAAIPAYAECNIADNRGSNCVNMTGVTRETNGSVTAYRMKFEYSGGPGCPDNVSVEGITGSSNQPGTIVGRRNANSTVTCTNTLGCNGFTGWMCKGDREKRASQDDDYEQAPPPSQPSRRKKETKLSVAKTGECRLADAVCSQECSDYYTINNAYNNSPQTNDLINQCLEITCNSLNKRCLNGEKINKQNVISLFKNLKDNPKYQRQATPRPAPKSLPRQASTKQSCRENYEKWIEVDPTNAKMQAAGAESYADCLSGRDPDRALDAWLNDPAKFEGSEVASNSSPMDALMPMLGGIAAARANSGNRGGYAPPSGRSTVSQPTPDRGPSRCTYNCNELVRGRIGP
jgi:hypothetical protein